MLGQGLRYDGVLATGAKDPAYPAIIDTGSSELSVPLAVFKQLAEQWKKDVPNLVCKDSKTFCHVQEPCETVVKKVKPLGFQFSDYVFELNAEEYLFPARKDACFFVIHKTDLGGNDKGNMYLVGGLFLQHFYSVYDFDKDEISLGVNSHSKGRVQMYRPGERPGELELK